MGTHAVICLSGIKSDFLNEDQDVLFFRHYDGYMGEPMANMFLDFCKEYFNSSSDTKDMVSAFIKANHQHAEFIGTYTANSDPFSTDVAPFIYILDVKTFSLEVTRTASGETLFNGSLKAFIDKELGRKSVVIELVEMFNDSRLDYHTSTSLIQRIESHLQTASCCNEISARMALDNVKKAQELINEIDLTVDEQNKYNSIKARIRIAEDRLYILQRENS